MESILFATWRAKGHVLSWEAGKRSYAARISVTLAILAGSTLSGLTGTSAAAESGCGTADTDIAGTYLGHQFFGKTADWGTVLALHHTGEADLDGITKSGRGTWKREEGVVVIHLESNDIQLIPTCTPKTTKVQSLQGGVVHGTNRGGGPSCSTGRSTNGRTSRSISPFQRNKIGPPGGRGRAAP